VTSHLLAIASEGLSNVIRHSRATRARIAVDSGPDDVGSTLLQIEDDGRGFDRSAAARHGHQGLSNMRERADAIGATIDWETPPRGGTRVMVRKADMERRPSP
jgi:two-component system nitrate/nitrite sensor histidine kinase NarX